MADADMGGGMFEGMDPWTMRNLPMLQMLGQFGAGMLQGSYAPPGQRATFGGALGQGMQQGMGGLMQGIKMGSEIGKDQAWRKAVQGAPQEYQGVLQSLGPTAGASLLGPLLAEQRNQQGLQQFGAPPTQATPPMPPRPPMQQGGGGQGNFMAQLAASEGGTGPGALTARNPRSSATGPYQFIDGTWRDFAKNNPQQFGGLNDAEVLSARSNPQAAQQGAQWYAQQGANALQQAGQEVTPATLALHHRFGPQGVQALLKAPPDAPVAGVLGPQVAQANPDLNGMTVGNLIRNTQMRFAGGGQGGQQGALTGPDGQPIMLPNGTRPATWNDINSARTHSNPALREWANGAMQMAQVARQQDQQGHNLVSVQGPNGPVLVPERAAAGLQPGQAPPQPSEAERMMPRWRELQAKGTMATPAEREELRILGQRLGGGGTNVNVMPQEKAEQKGTGEALAQEAAGVRTAADAAASTLDTVRNLRAIGAETGRLAPVQQFMGSWLESMGIKGAEAVKQASNLQAFNAISANYVLGKQMEQKGVQTEGDAQRMRETFGTATNTMEANNVILRAVEAQAGRAMEKDRFYQDWRAQPGSDGQPRNSVSGAAQEWQRYIRETPMVVREGNQLLFLNEYMEKAVPRLGGDTGAALQAWREYGKAGKR